MTARKEKLTGTRLVATGAVDLAMTTDRAQDAASRWFRAGLGAFAVTEGVGRLRGVKVMSVLGSAARMAVISGALLVEIRALLSARRSATEASPVDGPTTDEPEIESPPASAGASAPDRVTPSASTDPAAARLGRTERLRLVGNAVSGIFTFAIATDRGLDRRERIVSGVIGLSAVLGNVGILRRKQGLAAIGGLGYGAVFTYGFVSVIARLRGR